jgi:hypothetical protein
MNIAHPNFVAGMKAARNHLWEFFKLWEIQGEDIVTELVLLHGCPLEWGYLVFYRAATSGAKAGSKEMVFYGTAAVLRQEEGWEVIPLGRTGRSL